MTNFFFILPFSCSVASSSPSPTCRRCAMADAPQPLSHFLIIIRGIFLKGTGFSILWPQFLELAVLGGFVFALAVGRFRKRSTIGIG